MTTTAILINTKNVCRVCLIHGVQGENLLDIHLFLSAIMECAPVKILKNDGFPSSICLKCLDKLKTAQDFRSLCVNSDFKLRSLSFSSQDQIIIDPQLNVKTIILQSPVIPPSTKTNTDNGMTNSTHTKEIVQNTCDNTNIDKTYDIKPEIIKDTNTLNENSMENKFCTDILATCLENSQIMSNDFLDVSNYSNFVSDFSCSDNFNLSKDIEDINKSSTNILKTPINISNNHELPHQKIKDTRLKKSLFKNNCAKLITHNKAKNTENKTNKTANVGCNKKRKLFICMYCTTSFSNVTDLQKHSCSNVQNLQKCLLCTESFSTTNQLKKHVLNHTVKENFSCEYCVRTFRFREQLYHHKLYHINLKCEVCKKSHDSKSSLFKHLRKHFGKNKIKCDICGKSFLKKNEMHVHKRAIHLKLMDDN